MSNPTTPFSWQMPTATDLVTDLPADFAVFGQAVATSMADLLGGTTGQILAKTTNADMDFTWIANDQGDITGVTAGTGITVTSPTGPVPTVAIDATVATLTGTQTLTNKTLTSPALTTPTISTLTTSGDLLYGTGSGAITRLGVGSAGQVLTVAAGAPSWATATAGGMTQLATGTLSGTSVVLSSISGSYKHLMLDIYGATTNTADDYYAFRFNSFTSGSYTNSVYGHNGATAFNLGAQTNTSWTFQDTAQNMYLNGAPGENHLSLTFYDYAATTKIPLVKSVFSYQPPSGTYATQQGAHSYKASNAAITSLTIRTNGGQTFAAGTYVLWGIA